ncbi:hypothetical protein ACFW04_011206 [Cataglyphis niger]
MKEVMRRGGWGEINLGGMKIYTLAYTDDLKERSKKKKDLSKWEEERCGFFENRGMGMVEVEAKRSEGVLDFGYFVKKDTQMDKKERIEGSRYNWCYGKIKRSGISEYLKKIIHRHFSLFLSLTHTLRHTHIACSNQLIAAFDGQRSGITFGKDIILRNTYQLIADFSIQNNILYFPLKSDPRIEKIIYIKRSHEKITYIKRSAHYAQIDEINAARVQEEVEREWRQREKEEALKKLEAQRILQRDREEQINNKRVMQAIEIERERREFEKIVHVQRAAFCKEKKELEQKQQQILIHRNEILKQVNEKERERIAERQQMFAEGLTIRAETAMRKKKLQDTMERKCQEMRENKIPDIYINEVKRMIKNI